jgi:N-acetylmuramate 1-kinase
MSLMKNHEIDIQAPLKRFYGRIPDEVEIDKLKGDASTRSYYRLRVTDRNRGLALDAPRSLIIMQLPRGEFASDEAVQGKAPQELPFLNVQRMLKTRGVPVPEIYLDDSGNGIVFLEDLGNETFEARLKKKNSNAWTPMYAQAVDLLVDMHQRCDRPDSQCVAYSRVFDRELLRWELEHFCEWGLEALHGELSARDRLLFNDLFSRLVSQIERMPQGFVHRDFQSRNLMWAPCEGGEKLVVIDFQDAMIGPRPYDLVALLCDSYVALDLDLQETMVNHYLSRAGLSQKEASDFRAAFWAVAIHRKLKDAGRFVYIDRVRKNPDFLPYYPQSLCYVGRALQRFTGFEELDSLLKRLLPGFPDHVTKPSTIQEPNSSPHSS